MVRTYRTYPDGFCSFSEFDIIRLAAARGSGHGRSRDRNRTTSQALTDIGGGAAFYDNLVEIDKLREAKIWRFGDLSDSVELSNLAVWRFKH